MTPDVKEQIDHEIQHNYELLSDVDQTQIDTYRALFYSLNQETTDVSLIYRPAIDLISRSEKKLRELRKLYYSKKNRMVSDYLRSEFGLSTDPLSYSILTEMSEAR